ncbi:MAG: undecaprenyl-phosphate glucose phosphotransferase [Bacteroidetes bacterium]|nr:undecaprenyl-phosphate glucose phosphotransferase [Bacteroidota bacterium]
MLQEQSRFFQRMLFVGDFFLIAASWFLSYWIRFEVLTPPEWVPLEEYLVYLPWTIIVTALVFTATGLYAPSRAQSLINLVFGVAKSVAVGIVVLFASLFLYRAFSFSRLMFLVFGMILPIAMVAERLLLYGLARRRRLQGKGIKRVLIVGAGVVGRKLAVAFDKYPWMGFEIVGYLDDDELKGSGVLGKTEAVLDVVDRFEQEGRPVDVVYIALPVGATEKIRITIDRLSTRSVSVLMVPDLFQFDLLNSRVTHLDGLPIIHVIDEAPIEFSRILKRLFDIGMSVVLLILTSPLLLLIAVAVKLSSKGPVLYRQERMGLNGATFEMLKFRTMPVDAEKDTGAVWAKPGESRATRVGALLRRTSLDELPQFFNVLKGDMSVVGPRPERPVFIREFREKLPHYMLRHKTKAGITGWAQVNGWRGNTSLEKRIEYDLYYIQNWSFGLDLKIIALTVLRGFVHENAY